MTRPEVPDWIATDPAAYALAVGQARLAEAAEPPDPTAWDPADGPDPRDDPAYVPVTEDEVARIVAEAREAEEVARVDRPDDLAAALDAVVAFLGRFVVLRPEQAIAVGLWAAHTFAYRLADQSPILAVTSAEKRSGKSRLFDALAQVVASPWVVIRPSEAVLFRKIHADHPTLLIDEWDTIASDRTSPQAEGLRAILNGGNRANGQTARVVTRGREMVLVEFSTYCPKAVAGIGGLPPTVLDRSIVVRMVRRTSAERVERFRERLARIEAEPIRGALIDALASIRPALVVPVGAIPTELDDRAADGWEPLLAIADAAGGPWPAQARRSALALSIDRAAADEDAESLALRLLRDLRDAFADDGRDAIPTAALVERLHSVDDGPWADAFHGRGLTADRMRRLLARFGVRPTHYRPGGGAPTARGYTRASLVDPWDRYLPTVAPVPSPAQVAQTAQVARTGGFDHARIGPAVPPVPPVPSATNTGEEEAEAGLVARFVALLEAGPRPVAEVGTSLGLGAGGVREVLTEARAVGYRIAYRSDGTLALLVARG